MFVKYRLYVVTLLIIIISGGLIYLSYIRNIFNMASASTEDIYKDLFSGEFSDKIDIYISERSSHVISPDLIKYMGLNTIIFSSLKDLSILNKPSLLILHVDDITDVNLKPVDILNILTRSTSNINRLVIMFLNPDKNIDKTRIMFEIILKYYGYKKVRLIMPLEPYDQLSSDKLNGTLNKIHHNFYEAMAIGFSYNPNGVIIIEDLYDMPQMIIKILDWSRFIQKPISEPRLLRLLGSNSIIDQKGVNYLGYIGWKTSDLSGCGGTIGTIYVKVDYFYTNVTTLTGKTYHAWFAHIEHSAKGYATTCCWPFWPFCGTQYHYPSKFVSETNWKTSTFPGQVLDDWNPKNVGTAQTITFTVTWNVGLSLGRQSSLTVSYSTTTSVSMPNAPSYSWFDESTPSSGVARARHELVIPQDYDISRLNNVLFTVEPTSVAFLDPDKPGGVMPMILSHYFYTQFNTGESGSISFNVYLYDSSYREY